MSSVLPDRFYQLAIVLGGRTHDWFVREFCQAESNEASQRGVSIYGFMDSKASDLPPGSEGVLCIPQLGGRWNPVEPDARGLWMGFGWGHRKEHLYRSILESVAYEYAIYLARMRELWPQADFHQVRVISGGGHSRLWNQIKSDVLGIPYGKLARNDLATWGSALIAGHAVGIFPDLLAAARSRSKVEHEQQPEWSAHERYKPYVALYPTLFARNRDTFGELARIATRFEESNSENNYGNPR